jgi:hypothetical protein
MHELLPILVVYGTGLALAFLISLVILRLFLEPPWRQGPRFSCPTRRLEYLSVEIHLETAWYQRLWFIVTNPLRYLFTGKLRF